MVIPEDIEEKLGKGFTPLSVLSMETPPTVSSAHAAAAAPGSHSVPANVAEELTTLRRKLVQLTQENQKLHQDNQMMKEKLEQIKKIA
jgi:small-conductance mechanosensitive channel